MASNATSIMVMSLDAPGKATPVQQFNFSDDAKKNGVSIGASSFHSVGLVLIRILQIRTICKAWLSL